jgi:hypothetical protein
MIGGWGLRFLMDTRKKPLRTWFMCLGSGYLHRLMGSFGRTLRTTEIGLIGPA